MPAGPWPGPSSADPTGLHARSGAEQSGAMAYRSTRVQPEYQSHARALDQRFTPGHTPIADRLASYTAVRALTFGAYGEASPDVHIIIAVIARMRARDLWRSIGAR